MKRHPSLLFAAVLLAGCAGADARTITVTSDAELEDAVANARAGDRIQLASGRYGQLRIVNRRIEGAPVTITAAASGGRPEVANIDVDKSSGWVFDGLDIGGGSGRRNRVVMVTESADIAIRNNLIHGPNVNNDPWDDNVTGIGVRVSERVEISRNRLRDVGSGVSIANTTEILFAGNSIGFVREASQWVGTRKATLRCNRISHVYPNLLLKDHPDAIQGWWNAEGNNADMLVEGNVLSLGGPRAVQGIFLAGAWRPQDNHELGRQHNLTVRDNIYFGSSLHGISLGGLENAVIERNTVLPSPHTQTVPPPVRSADGRRSAALMPRIRIIGETSTGVVRNNIAPSFNIPPLMEAGNNLVVPSRSAGGKAWRKIFTTPPTGDDPPLESFLADPDSAAGKAGQGARAICGNLLPPPIDVPSGWDPSMAPAPG